MANWADRTLEQHVANTQYVAQSARCLGLTVERATEHASTEGWEPGHPSEMAVSGRAGNEPGEEPTPEEQAIIGRGRRMIAAGKRPTYTLMLEFDPAVVASGAFPPVAEEGQEGCRAGWRHAQEGQAERRQAEGCRMTAAPERWPARA